MLCILLFWSTSLALSAFAAVALYGSLREFVGALREQVLSWDVLVYGFIPMGRLLLWLILSVGGSWGLYHVLFG